VGWWKTELEPKVFVDVEEFLMISKGSIRFSFVMPEDVDKVSSDGGFLSPEATLFGQSVCLLKALEGSF
jgi:hypothetical protein